MVDFVPSYNKNCTIITFFRRCQSCRHKIFYKVRGYVYSCHFLIYEHI